MTTTTAHHYIVVADDGATDALTVTRLDGLGSWRDGFERVVRALCPELVGAYPVLSIDNDDGSRTVHLASTEGDLAGLPRRFVVFHPFN